MKNEYGRLFEMEQKLHVLASQLEVIATRASTRLAVEDMHVRHRLDRMDDSIARLSQKVSEVCEFLGLPEDCDPVVVHPRIDAELSPTSTWIGPHRHMLPALPSRQHTPQPPSLLAFLDGQSPTPRRPTPPPRSTTPSQRATPPGTPRASTALPPSSPTEMSLMSPLTTTSPGQPPQPATEISAPAGIESATETAQPATDSLAPALPAPPAGMASAVDAAQPATNSLAPASPAPPAGMESASEAAYPPATESSQQAMGVAAALPPVSAHPPLSEEINSPSVAIIPPTPENSQDASTSLLPPAPIGPQTRSRSKTPLQKPALHDGSSGPRSRSGSASSEATGGPRGQKRKRIEEGRTIGKKHRQ